MRLVERPEPLPEGARLLHIGLPKTGTTALQAALHAAREDLESRGAHNVSRIRHPFAIARYAAGGTGGSDAERLERRWARMARSFATSTARVTFFSSEALCSASPERIAVLKDQLGDDVHIVVTLRSLAALLPSLWQQRVRTGASASFEDWLRAVLQPDRRSGTPTVLGGYDVGRIIADWGAGFGEDRLVFLIGASADREFNLRAFEGLLGTPGALELQPLANASPPYPEVEMLRQFNLVHGRQGEGAAMWTKVLRAVGRQMGDNPHAGSGAQRVTAPRWAAEAVNEQARRDIAALEASDALVVGDPSNLLAHVDGHPEEVEPPDHVTVESAAWFARLVSDGAIEQLDAAHAKERRALRAQERRRAARRAQRSDVDSVAARDLARALARRVHARVRR